MSDVSHPRPRDLPPGHAGLLRAIEQAGGGAALARAVGVTRFAVQQWKQDGIPPARVPAVARLTGIPLHELRPDLFDAPDAPTNDPTPQQSEAA